MGLDIEKQGEIDYHLEFNVFITFIYLKALNRARLKEVNLCGSIKLGFPVLKKEVRGHG